MVPAMAYVIALVVLMKRIIPWLKSFSSSHGGEVPIPFVALSVFVVLPFLYHLTLSFAVKRWRFLDAMRGSKRSR